MVDDTRSAIAAIQLFEHIKEEISADTAHPDALYLALGRIDAEAGRKAFMRAVQKSLEVANASA